MQKIKKRKIKTFLLYFLCLWVSILGCSVDPAPIMESSGDADFARLLESIRVNGGLPALFAAVIVEGEIYVTAAVGTRKLGTDNWVTVDDKFLIGSCGKAFTATLAGILVQEGLLDWHTTLKDVFPEIMMLPEYEPITLEQLLSHRAGLPKNFIADLDENRPATPEGGRIQYVEQVVQTKLLNPPGLVMLYSNAGYVLAGAMMEKITSQPFEALISEKVFIPLKLDTASYVAPAELEPDSQPWGHIKKSWSYRAVRKDHNYWLDPAGSTLSISIKDRAKFIFQNMYILQTKNQSIIGRETIKKLHTPTNTLTWDYDEKYFATWNKLIGWPLTSANYALGWYVVRTDNGEDVLYHGGATKSFIADVYMSPKDKSAILLAANARTSHVPLYEGAKRISSYYSLNLSLP
jgi:CubicO group peptidase (beta-lactamase class C family)